MYRTPDPGSDIVIADFGIAKHLHGPDEQLTQLAGSFGYVAPEVLLNEGHGKPVDLWSTGIITYVLLCGYSPFRSEDVKTLVRETKAAKVEFHERYWKNVSVEAKTFILHLLNPDPVKRPTAEEGLRDAWLTTHEPSTEHDLAVGLREHFDPRKRWRSAINSMRAVGRLGSGLSVKRTSSSGSSAASGGWAGDSSDDSDEAVPVQGLPQGGGGDEHDNVLVEDHSDGKPLASRPEPELFLSPQMSEEPISVSPLSSPELPHQPPKKHYPRHPDVVEDDDDPAMPGSFYASSSSSDDVGQHKESWGSLFSKLRIGGRA